MDQSELAIVQSLYDEATRLQYFIEDRPIPRERAEQAKAMLDQLKTGLKRHKNLNENTSLFQAYAQFTVRRGSNPNHLEWSHKLHELRETLSWCLSAECD